MSAHPTWFDRLRIELVVRTVDVLTSALPARSQRRIRDELRANLRAAAAEVGTAEAIRRLGPLRPLAAGYVETEHGPGNPGPRWMSALVWVFVAELVILAMVFAGHAAFMSGIETANEHPAGTYSWRGLDWLGFTVDVGYADGEFRGFTMSITPWLLLYLVAAAALGGRLWRMLPHWRRRAQVVPES